MHKTSGKHLHVLSGIILTYQKVHVLQKYCMEFCLVLNLTVGLNNILFIQISPAKHVHTKFVEDLNESILLIEFISSCIIYTFYFVHCNSMTNILFKRYC